MLGREERDAIFTKGDPDENGKRFRERYPNSPGIITVSRVGLNRDTTVAVFDLGWVCGPLCGHGRLHVVKKEGDEWVEQRVQIGPMWTS